MYDGYAYSSSGPTFSGINIGAAVYDNNTEVKVNANSKAHIVGEYSPMYGSLTNHPAGLKPNIEMAHVAAVIGIKVVNNTVDDITVKNIKMVTNLPIVGHFSLDATKIDKDGNFLTDAFTPISGQSTNTVTITLASPVKIPNNGQSATIYFPARPFATKLKDIAIYINGSEKIPVSESVATFSSGRVTTLKVEVNPHTYPYNVTDVFQKKSRGRVQGQAWKWVKKGFLNYQLEVDKSAPIDQTHAECDILTFDNYTTPDIVINNEAVKAYILGKSGKDDDCKGRIKISGWAKEILEVLPASFYASRWNDVPTAMTVEYVNLFIPQYPTSIYTMGLADDILPDFSKLITRVPIKDRWADLLNKLGKNIPMGDNGIDHSTLTALGISVSTITFNGMIQNFDFEDENVLMIDEGRTNKFMSNEANGNVATYIDKFSYRENGQVKYKATIAGLRSILRATQNGKNFEYIPDPDYGIENAADAKTAAEETANAIYNRVAQILSGMVGDNMSTAKLAMFVIGMSDANAFMHFLREMKVELCISTCPVNGVYNPIVLWGMSANVD